MMSWLKHLIRQHTGERRGYVILNHMGGLWDMNLHPTVYSAMQRVRQVPGYREFELRIVPATCKLDWQRRPFAAKPSPGARL